MNDFAKRYRKAVSQQNAAKRMRRGKRRDKWAGKYLGVQKGPTRETKKVAKDGAGGADAERGTPAGPVRRTVVRPSAASPGAEKDEGRTQTAGRPARQEGEVMGGNGNGDNGTEEGVTEEQQKAWDDYQKALREKQDNPKDN